MFQFKPWMPPLIVAATVVPIATGFVLVGPPLGLAMGAFAVAVLLVLAARTTTKDMIETVPAADMRRRVLVVASVELDDPRAVDAISHAGEFDRPGNEAEVVVLAPATARRRDRWAVDVGVARAEAQRKLVLSVAALGKANVVARAVVGDPDLVLAVEDALREFAATEVILVSGAPADDPEGERAAEELEARLVQPLSRVIVASS